jgi:predicted Zn finger-like uncharacterized protein
MDVRCPGCAARYTADDEKLRGKTARMRCRACQTVWMVSGTGIEESAVPEPTTTERMPRAAAVTRRGAERERRDLFAERPVEEGAVRETFAAPPASAAPSSAPRGPAVAARNETSVLFKVDDLAPRSVAPASAKAGYAASYGPSSSTSSPPGPASVTPPALRRDDSGVIDLNALVSASGASGAPRAPVANLFGASEPPPAAFARELSAASASWPRQAVPAANSRMRKVGAYAATAAVVGLCAIGVVFAFGGDNPPPAPALTVAAPPPPTPVVAPTPEPEKVDTAPDSAAAAAEKTTTGSKSPRKGGHHAKGHTSAPAMRSATVAPVKVKPADPCGCHGDFNCVIACAAGKKP